MSKTWEDRPLSKSKIALEEISRQLEIIRNDVKDAGHKHNMSLLEKISVIEDWYALNHIVCNDMNLECEECPFCESVTKDRNEEECEISYNCKFEFDSAYAGDIVPYIEKYRERIDAYKESEDNDEIYSTIERRGRLAK